MTTVVLIAASLATLVLAALGIRAYCLVKRLHRLADQVGDLMDSDVGPTMRALGDTLRGAQGAVEKLDGGLASLASMLDRADRLTAELEPDSMTRTVMQPVVAKIVSWVSGVRKGFGSVRKRPAETAGTAEGSDTETG